MIGLRYGTVPVVRGVGGLLNTVFDWDYDEVHPLETRNGFVFFQQDSTALESALGRALDLWSQNPALFRQLALQGMADDNSWTHPAQKYLEIYEVIRHKWA
jgi:starch synthase